MVRDMDRSLSKFLYEYLPGNTLNHANLHISGKVTSVSSLKRDGNEVELKAPNSYVIRRVKQHFYRWPNSDDLVNQDLYANVDIMVPGYAQYHTYPLTFECPNPGCGMFIKFRRDDERDFVDRDPDELLHCDHCGARIGVSDQLPFVAICECGAIDQLWAPTHKHDGTDLNMRLDRPTTRMRDWEWQCVHDGCSETVPFIATPVDCPDPSCGNEGLEVVNHTDSSVFYPQTENFINLQDDLGNLDNTGYRARIISDYILADERNMPSESEIKSKAAEILGGAQAFIDADEDEEQRAREEAWAALTADRQQHQRQIAGWLDGLDSRSGYDETEKVGLAEECYEYLSLTRAENYEPTNDFSMTSFGELAANPENTHLDEATLIHYENLRDSLSIDTLHLIEDIPITTVTYGYTRVNSEADGQGRNPAITGGQPGQDSGSGGGGDDSGTAVSDGAGTGDAGGSSGDGSDGSDSGDDGDGDDSADESVPVELNPFTTRTDPYPTFYAQENRAEGVLIELDEKTVLDWLETNGVISSETRPAPDEARMWFVDAVRQPDRYQTLRDHNGDRHLQRGEPRAVSRHVYTLLNTFAHATINSIAVLSGVQRESLVERIMPRTLSFLIYKRPDTDQAFGTVLSLFEERFDEFVDQFEDQEACPLSRVCFHDENGACEHCLYLPAMSTENTNHNLSRATLFGGCFDEGTFDQPDDEIDGFL